MTNITVDFSLFPIFYDEVCDFSGSKVAVFICSNGDGFPLILSSVPKYHLVAFLVRMRFFLLYFLSQSAFSELQVEIWMPQQ